MVGVQLGREAKKEEQLRLPQHPGRRTAWILAALQSSTKGLKKPGVATRALERVNVMLDTMVPGGEQAH